MALLIMVNAASAIQEQTNRGPFPLRISEGERDSQAFFNFWCCKEIWFGLNRTSHPDWVEMFGDFNSQIKLRAKQKFKFLSATHDMTQFEHISQYYSVDGRATKRGLFSLFLVIFAFSFGFFSPIAIS